MANYSFTVKRYKVYFNGTEISSGVSDVVTPKVTFPKATIGGAGIAGELSMPILGMPSISPATINWHGPSTDFYGIFTGGPATIKFSSAIYQYNSTGVSNGQTPNLPTLATVPEIIVMTCFPDEIDPGRREASNKAAGSQQFSVSYLYLELGGKEYLELDPMSGVCRLNGVDVNANDGI
jgi:P2 family phage contractile tail tube protein